MKSILNSWVLFAVALIGIAGETSAQASPKTTLVTVIPSSDGVQPQYGNAFTVADGSGGCTFVTAGHLVKNTQTLSLRQSAATPEFKRQFPFANFGLDVALSTSEDATHFGGCPGVPSHQEIKDLLNLDVLRLNWYSTGFDLVSIPVYVKIQNEASTTVTVKPLHATDQFFNGMSGAPLLANNLPVGVLLSVSGQEATVLRLDKIPSDYRDMLSTGPAIARATKAYEAYSIEQLPPAIAVLVGKARNTRLYAENSTVAARETEKKAQASSDLAKTLPFGEARGGHMQFKASNLNDYSGMVNQKSSLFGSTVSSSAYGYGISVSGSGTAVNNQYLCNFNLEGICEGQGVIRFAANVDNPYKLKEWAGGIVNGNRNGFGTLTAVDGSVWYINRHINKKNEVLSEPGVLELPDGRRFEGLISSQIEKGVMWDSKGKIICVAIWTEDGLVDPVATKAGGLPGCPN